MADFNITNGFGENEEQWYIDAREICIPWAVKNYRIAWEAATNWFQEAFTIFLTNMRIGRVTHLTAKPSTYVTKIMINTRSKPAPPPPEPRGNTTLEREEIISQVQHTLNGMGQSCYAMLTLRFFWDLSFEEIAGILRYKNEEVVRNLIARCYKKFRGLFSLSDEEDDAE